MKKSSRSFNAGFTIAELIPAVALAALLSVFVFALVRGNTILFAKNISTNLTHTAMRGSLDKLMQGVSAGCTNITLIDTAGATVTSGSAAGIKLDRYLGGPYVMTHPGGTGITTSSGTIRFTRSFASTSAAPLPNQNEVVLVDGSSVRLKVSSATETRDNSTLLAAVTVTLNGTPSGAISWQAARVKPAKLVRREAYIVVPVGSRNELRYFADADSVTNFSTATNYSLVIKNVGIDSGDSTPFSLSSQDAGNYLKVTLRVRSDQYGTRLSTLEKSKWSSIQRIEYLMDPRGFNTN